MLKYILKGENNIKSPIETILKNRNITHDLFEIDENVIEDYNNYDNIQEGIDLLISHINNGNKIEIVVDPDVDGITSSAILYRYIKEVFNYDNLYYKIHTKKQHGLSDDIEIDEATNLIILPDSSSNDYEKHSYYKNKGMDILVLDHHEADKVSKDAIVINNQLSDKVKNKNLSGVGVVYKFLKALDDCLFDDKADKYLDCVALGNIADVINLTEEETRYLCYKGMEKINNTFLKALVEKNAFQMENKYNINKLGWVLAPKLNGTIRSGSVELKEDMFKAFILDDYNFALEVADKCKGAKDNQDSEVKTALGKIEKDIHITEEDRCLILEVSDTLSQAHTGLVAGKLAEKYGMPTLLYRKIKNKNNIYGGSGRGNINITNDFRQDLENSELFELAQGHANAFGFEFKVENLSKIKEYLNKLYKNKEVISGKIYEVDLILTEDTLNNEIIKEIAEYEDEWGNGISEPLIAFENIMINIEDENIKGTRAKTMVFECKGVKFVKKFLSNDLKNRVLNKGFIFVNIVGKAVNNIYNGSSYPQIEVIDIQEIE